MNETVTADIPCNLCGNAVGGVLWITSRPQTMRQFAKLAAWAAPLFALPAYC